MSGPGVARAGVCRSTTSLSVRDPLVEFGLNVAQPETCRHVAQQPAQVGVRTGEAVEVKAVYRIDHHPAKDHSSLEKHTGDIRVRNLIKLFDFPRSYAEARVLAPSVRNGSVPTASATPGMTMKISAVRSWKLIWMASGLRRSPNIAATPTVTKMDT